MADDRFEPAVCDFEASKAATKEGRKVLIEAKLKGVKDGVPHEEFLTCFNVSKYITRKSKLGGNLDASQSSVSGKGHCLKVLSPHLIVKRHKTEEKERGLSDEQFEAMGETDDGFADVEDNGFDFNASNSDTDFKSTPGPAGPMPSRQTANYSGDTSALDTIPVQFGNMNISQQTQGMQPQSMQYANMAQTGMAQAGMQYPQPPHMANGQWMTQSMQQPPQVMPPQGMPPQGMPQQAMQQPQGMPNSQYYQTIMQNNARS
jgi:hypothetical protein